LVERASLRFRKHKKRKEGSGAHRKGIILVNNQGIILVNNQGIISEISKELEIAPTSQRQRGEEKNLENTKPSEQQKSKLSPKYLGNLVG
jgi:hypothetical protein